MLAALLLLVSASAYATDRPKAEVLVRAPHEIPGLSIDEGRMEVVPAHDPEQVLVILRGRFLREGWVLQASPGDFRAPRPVSGDFELAIPVRAHDRVVSIELQAQSRLGPGESEFLTLRMPEITRWFRETSIWLTSGYHSLSNFEPGDVNVQPVSLHLSGAFSMRQAKDEEDGAWIFKAFGSVGYEFSAGGVAAFGIPWEGSLSVGRYHLARVETSGGTFGVSLLAGIGGEGFSVAMPDPTDSTLLLDRYTDAIWLTLAVPLDYQTKSLWLELEPELGSSPFASSSGEGGLFPYTLWGLKTALTVKMGPRSVGFFGVADITYMTFFGTTMLSDVGGSLGVGWHF